MPADLRGAEQPLTATCPTVTRPPVLSAPRSPGWPPMYATDTEQEWRVRPRAERGHRRSDSAWGADLQQYAARVGAVRAVGHPRSTRRVAARAEGLTQRQVGQVALQQVDLLMVGVTDHAVLGGVEAARPA